ncbi:MAG: MBL fold metallo-hydrolase, partial [Actinobacteria bacterium]|nr:MBL fold metallo-hydrolase [Actinomycetota bacterium]
MANFAYLIGDRDTGECMVVDPAYGVAELNEIAKADGMRLTGALITHYHADHCGGEIMGMQIEGVAQLLELTQIPVHI